MKKYLLILFCICLLSIHYVWAQGCSDAGFCTMGAMKPDQRFSKKGDVKIRSLEVSQYVGRTKFNDFIITTTADLNIGIGKKNTAQLKLPYTFVRTVLGNFNGMGDISVSFTRNLIANEKFQINATIGAKIPTSNADQRSQEGLPLPMYHQTSLGTYDLVAGASFITKQWLIAVGYQHPFNQVDNQFLWEAWEENPLFEKALPFPQFKLLRRKSDAMLRVERNFRLSRFSVHIGLLEIYRFNQDNITNPQNKEIESQGSNGHALSLIVGSTYHLNAKSSLKFIFGDRWLERERNPDGLSREQVWNLAYQLNF